MIMNQTPYPISFEMEMSQALVCRYGEEMRQYVFKPDIDVSGLSCLLQIAKTDGTFTENGVEVHTDPDTGECTLVITIPKQATVVKGLNRYSICVYGEIEGENHLLYSAEGPLWVDDDLITDEMIASVAEVNGLVFPRDFLTVENLVDIVNYVVAEIIKDDTTSDSTTWSSQKISDEISGYTQEMDLEDLTDVVITSPQTGDIIRRNNSNQWVNTPLPDVSVAKTATGNPIELTDAAAAPLVKCVTQITGSQDLHGYDKPWVGGSGSNKWDEEWELGTINVTNGQNVEVSTNIRSKNYIPVLPNTSYYFLRWNIAGNIIQYDENKDFISTISSPTSFTTSAATKYVRFYMGSGYGTTYHNDLAVNYPSTVTTYSPYSNICPITAYTEGKIEVSDGDGNTTTHTTTYPNAIYRGSEDCVGGTVTTDWGMIASYAGETLPGEWISDRDEYAPGTTPTTGAQVAYELATPTTSSVTPTNLPIKSLSGYNHIESSTGEMEVEYITQTYEPIVNIIPEEYPGHIYSTTERVVGKWIDGRPVYEKTFEVNTTTPLGVNSYSLPHGITNLERVLNYHGSTYWPGAGGYMIPSLSPDGSTDYISLHSYNSTYLGLSLSDSMKNVGGAYYIDLTIQYIKEV